MRNMSIERAWNSGLRRAAAGVIAAGCVLAVAGMAMGQGSPSASSESAKVGASDRTRVATLELEGSLGETPSPFAWLAGPEAEPTLHDVVRAVRDVADDESIEVLLLRLKDASLSQTQTEEIGAAIAHVRAAGKKVHIFSDMYGPTELLLASYTDDAMIQRGAPVMLPGMHMEEMFLADTLGWVGVKADFVQVGDYKGASEQMGRSAPSPEWNQNIDQLLDSMYGNLRGTIKTGRSLSDQQLDDAMRKAWLADAKDAAAVKLVDSVIDLPDLPSHLESVHGGKIAWAPEIKPGGAGDSIDMSNPFAIFSLMSKKPSHDPKGPTVAVLHINGAIMDGDSSSGGLFGGEGSVGSRTIRNAIEEILSKDLIKGVVVRIDSPGGSATASEIIWQGLRRLAEKKPVWVSVGSMAASGGYYCAVAADKIYVNPSSIVGSIGVVGGRMSLEGLYEKVKVNVVSRSRGPVAAMFRSTTPWTDAEREMVRAKMKETYDQFTSRVTGGRAGIDLSKTAEGRLFTGDKAIGLKMADAIGGLDVAVRDLAASLELEDFDIMNYPGPKSFQELLEDAFGQASSPADVAAALRSGGTITELGSILRELVGPQAYAQIATQLNGLMQLRKEPVLLMSPRAIVVR